MKGALFHLFMSFKLTNKQKMPSASNMAVSVAVVTHGKKKKGHATVRSPIAIYISTSTKVRSIALCNVKPEPEVTARFIRNVAMR